MHEAVKAMAMEQKLVEMDNELPWPWCGHEPGLVRFLWGDESDKAFWMHFVRLSFIQEGSEEAILARRMFSLRYLSRALLEEATETEFQVGSAGFGHRGMM